MTRTELIERFAEAIRIVRGRPGTGAYEIGWEIADHPRTAQLVANVAVGDIVEFVERTDPGESMAADELAAAIVDRFKGEMTMPLEPTPERIAAAKRASGRDWTFGPEGTVAIITNPVLADMVDAGLIQPRFVSPQAQIGGQDDYYRLTEAGRAWLDNTEERN